MGVQNTVNESGEAFNNYDKRYKDAMKNIPKRDGPGARAARFLEGVSKKYPSRDKTTRINKYKNQ